jgi:flagellar protein FlbD
MIYLTRLDGTRFVLNSEIIELIEEKPYTIITTTSGKKYIVKEEAKEIIEKAIKYKREFFTIDYKEELLT